MEIVAAAGVYFIVGEVILLFALTGGTERLIAYRREVVRRKGAVSVFLLCTIFWPVIVAYIVTHWNDSDA